MVYARRIADQEMTFGVSGMLMLNALVMYDHQTDSLWSQFYGEAVAGPLKGTELQLLPARMTTWGAWKSEHPDTTALDKGEFSPISGASYFFGLELEAGPGEGLPSHDLVLGVVDGTTQRAYPFRYLRHSPIVNDTLGERPIVVTYDGWSAAAAFHRLADGKTPSFRPAGTDAHGNLLMEDAETGTLWRAMAGEALEGPLAGSELEPVAAHLSFWFAWLDHYPQTGLYRLPD